MRLHKLSSMILVAAFWTTSFAQGGDHAAWPDDWNDWSDPALWATVGNAGNVGEQSRLAGYGDATYYGSVGDAYKIGKYEVTARQYTAFLNAVAQTDAHGLYNASMWSNSSGCKIRQSGASGNYTYSVADGYANRPVNYVSFWDAVRFTNWLHGGDTESGAYHNVGDPSLFGRNSNAKFFIPTENEWYKAAYHKNDGVTGNYWDYPTGADTPSPGRDLTDSINPGNNANYYGSTYPIDSPYCTTLAGEFQSSASPYGTFDQGGNVVEWSETAIVSSCSLRGGSFLNDATSLAASSRYLSSPTSEDGYIGFRVASVPEPGSLVLLAGIAVTALLYYWRKHA
jgi:sulfatase modifying factor 1